ncbi:hypothetical protein RND15_52575, partial [Streptomyces sp. DSM 41529]|nr:hypothetical protein [Streptomyces sp. DSM 41529]
FQIKVPMIRPTVVLTLLFTCVGAIQLFDAPKLVQLRANTMGEDWSPTMFIYTAAFKGHDYGLAAASSLLLALVAGLLSWFAVRGLAKTGALSRFASGRIGPDAR